jgi:Cysteine-rich secretory protein family
MSKATIGKRGMLALAAAALALSVVPQVAFAQEINTPADPVRDEQTFVDEINKSRAAVGVAPLTVHPGLVEVARGWAETMRKTHLGTPPPPNSICTISHNPNLKYVLPKQWNGLGENVGCGNDTAANIHIKFVESPHHYENIVNPKFDKVGIGIVYDGDIMFVTEQFMDSAETPAGAPNELALAPVKKDAKVLAAAVIPPATQGRKPVKVRKSKAKAKPAAAAPARV